MVEHSPHQGQQSPINWAKKHINQIHAILLEQRSQEPARLISDIFSYRSRRLSEMPLCQAWRLIESDSTLQLPEGFTIVDGAVSSYDTTINFRYGNSEYHTYLEREDTSGERMIFCLTGAQFVLPPSFREDHKGSRMHILRERAVLAGRPDIYTILPFNIGVIYGTAADIHKILGLEFMHRRPSAIMPGKN